MRTGPRIYNLFPSLVGTTAEWAHHVPRVAAMNFDWIYLNPFHATGYSGSLYAVADYYALDPQFRPSGTVSDDDALRAFLDAAHAQGIAVMMDLVVNHTARGALLSAVYPEWYRHDEAGEIASPYATDPADPTQKTVWTDLAELDYTPRPARGALVASFVEVVQHYARLGFDGFRCDAAYKVPADVWSTLIAGARHERPAAIFAAETLGAPFEDVLALRSAGFDYLFNSSKWWDFRSPWLLEQYERFREIAPSIAFPESHDTPRLAADAAEHRFRYLFAAFFSSGVMMPIGYEFGFARALDVVMTRPDQWETPRFDISAFIADVNAMKAAIPALNEEGAERALWSGRGPVALVREANAGESVALALVNPEPQEAAVRADAVLRALDGVAPTVDVTPDGAPASLVPSATMVLRPLEIRVFTNEQPVRPSGPPAAERRRDARPCVIEAVAPQIDGGRHPVKRIVGDRLVVEADVFREGHDLIGAALLVRAEDETTWRESPMMPVENDRWRGTALLARNGRYRYTIEAWPDAFASWRHDVEPKRDAGQALALELIEGRELVAAALERAPDAERAPLQAALQAIDAHANEADRAEVLLGGALAGLMSRVPDRTLATRYGPELEAIVDRRAAQIGAWYELFPRSQSATPGAHGTFADTAKRLPSIRAMGFDVVYLPPVHPIGHAFRKGRNNSLDPAPGDPGSPWAIGNEHGGHTAVEPALGTIDDFDRLVESAHRNGIEIALDYALQCSPDHPWVREHPEWFAFRPDGSIKYAENPPKKYQDIVNFNWFGPHAAALWDALRDVVEFWIGHGVRIFRVDNPHTKPFAFWEWMIRDVQSRHPDTIFLAEAFTRPKVMRELAKLGFTQSYTYFTWRNFKAELTDYVRELATSEMAEYYRPNFFANTPDILPPFLQTGGRPAFRIRLVLAATLSSLYGIYSGFELCENAALPGREEYADSEKYEIKVRDWDAPGNIVADVAAINRIRRENPALHDWRNVRFLLADDDEVLFYEKRRGDNVLWVAVLLDPFRAREVRLHLPLADFRIAEHATFACDELLAGERVQWRGGAHSVWLDPQHRPAVVYRLDARLGAGDESASD